MAKFSHSFNFSHFLPPFSVIETRNVQKTGLSPLLRLVVCERVPGRKHSSGRPVSVFVHKIILTRPSTLQAIFAFYFSRVYV